MDRFERVDHYDLYDLVDHGGATELGSIFTTAFDLA